MAVVQATYGRTKLSSNTVAPDFLILGAAKAGTTSLHAWLRQHPQLLMSLPKEPFYFELEYENGSNFYLSRYFPGADGRRLLGEARSRNLLFPWVPERVRDSNPDAKLIILLRNPVERCLSHWWMDFRRRKDPLHFEEAILANLQQFGRDHRFETAAAYRAYMNAPKLRDLHRTYLDCGHYAEQIERYRSLFPDKQIRIFLLEDIEGRPKSILHEICNFLGVGTDPVKDIDCSLRNVKKDMKHNRAIKYWFQCRLQGKTFPYGQIRHCPKSRPEFRRFLAEYFRERNGDLPGILKRDLSHWS